MVIFRLKILMTDIHPYFLVVLTVESFRGILLSWFLWSVYCWVLLHLKHPWLEPFTILTDENTQKQVDDLGAQFTDHFIQDPEHLTLLLTLLEVLDLFYSQKYACCNISVNGGPMLFLGVWLPCAVAWGKTVDCSAKEPGATGPRCHPGQPHG